MKVDQVVIMMIILVILLNVTVVVEIMELIYHRISFYIEFLLFG